MSLFWRKPPPETKRTHGWGEADMNDLGSFGSGPYATGNSWFNVVVNEVLFFPVRLLFWTAKLLIWAFVRLKSVLVRS